MDTEGLVPRSRSLRASEAGLQTSETRLFQRRHHASDDDVGLIVGQKFHAPTSDAAAALRLDFDRTLVAGSGNPGDQCVAIDPLRVVDCLEPLDDFPAVARFEPAELTHTFADQTDSRHRRMPVETELPNH